jgi:hypothetical protein
MPRVRLRPYAVILELPRPATTPGRQRKMTVRIWARDREDAMARAPEIYGGTAIAAQHCPYPLP